MGNHAVMVRAASGAATATVPHMAGIVRVVLLGSVQDDLAPSCRWCGDDQVALYVGFSTVDEVIDVERTFICEACETIVLRDSDEF